MGIELIQSKNFHAKSTQRDGPSVLPSEGEENRSGSTGSQTPKYDGELTPEGQEVLFVFGVVFLLWRLTEYCSFDSFTLFWFWKLSIRSAFGFLILWTIYSVLLYRSHWQQRKNRWEPGCSSYSQIPCPGARAMKEWKTKGPVNPWETGVLDMDHIRLPFLDFLWCRIFIVLPYCVVVLVKIFSFTYNRAAFLRVYVRRYLERVGLLAPLDLPDPRKSFARFIVGCTGVIYFEGPLKHKEDGSVEGTFIIQKAAIPCGVGEVEYGLFKCVVDVENQWLLHAEYTPEDGPNGPLLGPRRTIEMGPSEALVLLMCEMDTHHHPQMHAFANWGLSTNSPDAFIARMSKISVMYNHMGKHGGPGYFDILHRLGLCEYVNYETWNGKKELYKHGEQRTGWTSRIQQHPVRHRETTALMKYSPFVSFVIKMRQFFMKEFKKYAHTDFVGVHPEALFLGTVLHSIDHEQAFLVDVHEFRAESEKFALLCDLMIPAHFIADGCHWFPFPTSFKEAPHPFYKAVYKHAKQLDETLNTDLADLMDACIIR